MLNTFLFLNGQCTMPSDWRMVSNGKIIMPVDTPALQLTAVTVFEVRNHHKYACPGYAVALVNKPFTALTHQDIVSLIGSMITTIPGWDIIHRHEIHASNGKFLDALGNEHTYTEYINAPEILIYPFPSNDSELAASFHTQLIINKLDSEIDSHEES